MSIYCTNISLCSICCFGFLHILALLLDCCRQQTIHHAPWPFDYVQCLCNAHEHVGFGEGRSICMYIYIYHIVYIWGIYNRLSHTCSHSWVWWKRCMLIHCQLREREREGPTPRPTLRPDMRDLYIHQPRVECRHIFHTWVVWVMELCKMSILQVQLANLGMTNTHPHPMAKSIL